MNQRVKSVSLSEGLGRPVLLIVLAVFAVHGLLLLNDGIYWDGWLIFTYLQSGDWATLKSLFTSAGSPVGAYMHGLMGLLPKFVVAYKVAAFSAIMVTALAMYRTLELSRLTTRAQSIAIAILSMAYPGFQVSIELIMLPCLVCHALFWLGTLLFTQSLQSQRQGYRFLYRMAAALLFFFSFTINSLVVMYGGVVAVLLGMQWLEMGGAKNFRSLCAIALRHLDVLALPFVYWGFKSWVWPRGDLYQDYNVMHFSVFGVVKAAIVFVKCAVLGQFADMFRLMRSHVLPVVIVTGAIGGAGIRLLRGERWHFPGGKLRAVGLVTCGAVFFGLAIAPYALVGKTPDVHGWTTRHALLVGFPLAMVLVGLLSFLPAGKRGGLSWSGGLCLCLLLAGFGAIHAYSYLGWEAQWVKDRSVMVNLGALNDGKDYSVYWVHDEFVAGSKTRGVLGHSFYEWSSMLNQVWGGEARIGLYPWRDPKSGLDPMDSPAFVPYEPRIFLNKCYVLEGVDLHGPQAVLTIQSGGQPLTEVGLSARYLYYRFLKPAGMSDFLSRLSAVSIRPIEPKQK